MNHYMITYMDADGVHLRTAEVIANGVAQALYWAALEANDAAQCSVMEVTSGDEYDESVNGYHPH